MISDRAQQAAANTGGSIPGYSDDVLALSPILYWPLADTTGLVASEAVAGQGGAYGSGVGLGKSGPYGQAIETDGTNTDYVNIYDAVNSLLESHAASVEVLTCQDSWMGVTYREDKPGVVEQISSYISQGTYPKSLWN